MSVFDSLNETSAHAINAGENVLKTSHDYYKLKIFQQLSVSISMVLKAVIIGGFALIGFAFMAIALAFFIGALLGNTSMGFITVGLLFVFVSILLFFNRQSINKSVIHKLSKSFFK